jgi:hypothetical protein
MRNDARPIGEDAGRQSPVRSDPAARNRKPAASDPRDRVMHDRESHTVNRRTDVDVDPVLPTADSTLNTKI